MQFCRFMKKNDKKCMRPCIHSLRPAGFGKVWQSFKMKKIIFATGNQGKMKEIREIWGDSLLQGEEVEILSMKEAGIQTDIVEDGSSFTENAVIKAKAVAALAPDAIVMADDSGLEIDYLNKEPGIYSARYLGENTSYQIKNANLIERLSGVPDGRMLTELATIEGRIGYEERGKNGFGFDPIFMVPEYGVSTAELSEEEKNRISHRGKALRAMKEKLCSVL